MAVIAISRQVAALGDEIAEDAAKLLGYKFFNRKLIEQRIIELGFSADKLKKYDERKPGFFASLAKTAMSIWIICRLLFLKRLLKETAFS